MLRGIDRQLIFEDSEDYIRFLDIVEECREVCNFQLYAYCLMGNHVHLLLTIHTDEDGRPMVAPTVDRVIQQMKGYVTKRIGFSVWQT